MNKVKRSIVRDRKQAERPEFVSEHKWERKRPLKETPFSSRARHEAEAKRFRRHAKRAA